MTASRTPTDGLMNDHATVVQTPRSPGHTLAGSPPGNLLGARLPSTA